MADPGHTSPGIAPPALRTKDSVEASATSAKKLPILSLDFFERRRNDVTIESAELIEEANNILKEIREHLDPKAALQLDARLQKTLMLAKNMEAHYGIVPKFVYVYIINPRRLKRRATKLLQKTRLSRAEVNITTIAQDFENSQIEGGRGDASGSSSQAAVLEDGTSASSASQSSGSGNRHIPPPLQLDDDDDMSISESTSSLYDHSCEPTDEGTPTPTRVAFGDNNISILPAEFFDRIHATNSTIEHAAEVITDNINVAFGVAY